MSTKLTLKFPAPGTYKGLVQNGKARITRNSRFGRLGGADRARRMHALRRAKKDCAKKRFRIGTAGERAGIVRVFHLSRPRFLIGEDDYLERAGVDNRYELTGPEPPTGDDVKAVTGATRPDRWGFGYRWQATCKGARVVKPYPH